MKKIITTLFILISVTVNSVPSALFAQYDYNTNTYDYDVNDYNYNTNWYDYDYGYGNYNNYNTNTYDYDVNDYNYNTNTYNYDYNYDFPGYGNYNNNYNTNTYDYDVNDYNYNTNTYDYDYNDYYPPDNSYYPPDNYYPPTYPPDTYYPPTYPPDTYYPPTYPPDTFYPPTYPPDIYYPPSYPPYNPPTYPPYNPPTYPPYNPPTYPPYVPPTYPPYFPPTYPPYVPPTTPTQTCPNGQVIPITQTCPTTNSCPKDAQICSDGTVVGRTGPNCQFVCPTPQTRTCPNGQVLPINQPCPPQTRVCADGTVVNIGDVCYRTCPNAARVPEGQSCPRVCPDGNSPINNVCYQTCPNGARIPESQSCPTLTRVCPDGSVIPVNQSCPVRTCLDGTTVPISGICYRQCSDNTTVPEGSVCYRTCPNGTRVPETNVCPNLTQVCFDGSVIPVSQACPPQFRTCPNGTSIPIGQTCSRICQNGSVINEGGVCYRTCPNGASIPETQSCPVVATLPWVNITTDKSVVPFGGQVLVSWTSQNTVSCFASNGWSGNKSLSGTEQRYNISGPTTFTITCRNANGQTAVDSVTVYSARADIKVNSVITSIPTEITESSARCNGIGLIAGGAPSNAWFEYGETPSLGKSTATAYIGTSHTAPFSNKLVGLKSGTKYYCRAAMSNSNGTVKGDIVSFTTKTKKTTYVNKVVTKKTATKTVVKEIVCTDGTTVSLDKDSMASDVLVKGGKLITLQLDKVGGEVNAGSEVTYRLTYKNVSGEALKNVTFRITIPSEHALLAASGGAFDKETSTITVPMLNLADGAQGEITWKVRISPETTVGKSLVTNAYVSYNIPGTSGDKLVQDEVTTYLVSPVMPTGDGKVTSTTTKKTLSKVSFLPNTLIEWFALFAIILILMILGRSVYMSWRGNEGVRR